MPSYAKLTGSTSFAAAGGLAATKGSFADYAAAIVSNVASKASQASATYTAKQTAQSTYASSLSSQSGVNLDEEIGAPEFAAEQVCGGVGTDPGRSTRCSRR